MNFTKGVIMFTSFLYLGCAFDQYLKGNVPVAGMYLGYVVTGAASFCIVS
jgi:hypothetical protein